MHAWRQTLVLSESLSFLLTGESRDEYHPLSTRARAPLHLTRASISSWCPYLMSASALTFIICHAHSD